MVAQLIIKSISYRFSLLLIVALQNMGINAQNSTIDSLERVLTDAIDTNRHDILLALSTEWRYKDPERSRNYANEVLEDINKRANHSKIPYRSRKAIALQYQGISYSMQGNYSESLRLLTEAQLIFHAINDPEGLAKNYNNIGIVYDYQRNGEKAIEYYNKGDSICRVFDIHDLRSSINNNLGSVYLEKGYYKIAKSFFEKSLTISQNIDDSRGKGYAYFNLGICADYTGDPEEALDLFLKSLEIRESLGNMYDISSSLNSIGVIYNNLNKLEKALEFHNRSLEIGKELDLQSGMASSYNNIGSIYLAQEKYLDAERYFVEALKLFEANQDKLGISRSYMRLGNLKTAQGSMPENITAYGKALALAREIEDQRGEAEILLELAKVNSELNDYNKAVVQLKSSLNISSDIKAADLKSKAALRLSELYQDIRNYKESLDYYKIYKEVEDSIFNKSMADQVAELDIEYETEKKEQTIVAQGAQLDFLEQQRDYEQNLRRILSLLAIALLISALLAFSRYRLKLRTSKSLAIQNTKIEHQNAEIRSINIELEKRMLRAQMDPHFLFNSLNSIQHFITINDRESALKYLSKFSKLIREVLENSVSQSVSLKEELRLIEFYIQLEQLRLNNKFDYSIEIDDGVDVYEQEIPFLLLQPYVENAIIHGLRNAEGMGMLHIHIQAKEKLLVCSITDNGIGREKSAEIQKNKTNNKSRGTSITEQRLNVINRHSSTPTQVSITDLYDDYGSPTGTRVDISLPLQYELI